MIEGDLFSYFDTVHHRLLMKAVRRRVSDAHFMALLWKTINAGHIDVGLFRAASEGVPQGGVISPLLSNIMLNELYRPSGVLEAGSLAGPQIPYRYRFPDEVVV